ncbi:Protein Wnt-11 [Hypsibius exemplaris]|uniref:Protein Wnt n=1 Tax=Hypsibius exemplaris TaxID=2072580 RepID=A0A1W0X1E1_HYPEX|nr:Protein Wnt-11 [Hypsibius exemplaris]
MNTPIRSCLWCLHVLWTIANLLFAGCSGIKWLGLSKANLTWTASQDCRYAFKMRYLDAGQQHFCKRYFEAMPYVAKASREARIACQTQFYHHRWNCSSVELAPNYLNDLKQGTREQAFVAALSSAAVVHSLAKACAAGSLPNCNCGPMPNEPPSGDFKWGGCADDVSYGMKVSRLFTDVPYNFKYQASYQQKKKDRIVTWKKSRMARAELTLHNQLAGRRVVESSLTRHCKCHGVSGSCQIRTCWKSLPTMKEISEQLYRNFKRAVEVRRQGITNSFEPIYPLISHLTAETLLFSSKSPDHCTPDEKFGSLGTKNRICNATSSGPDNCGSMCCGRGHFSYMKRVPVSCNCKYIWCCRVECQSCQQWVHVTRCK